MCRDDISSVIGRHARTAHNKGYVNVFFVPARFPWLKTVLSDVEPVVAAVDDVRVVENTVILEATYEAVDQLINGL